MAKQRMIDTRFWDDNYTSNLDPIEKLLFLYCLTNTHTNICWIYEIPLKSIASDTGIEKEMVLKVLWRFERDRKMMFRDGWIVIFNFVKYQNQWSPKVKAWIDKEMEKVPKWLTDAVQIPYVYPMETVSHSNSNSNLNSNSNSNTNFISKDTEQAPKYAIVEIEQDEESKELQKHLLEKTVEIVKETYWKEELNLMQWYLRKAVWVTQFKDSKERWYVQHCYSLLKKIWREEFETRLKEILSDQFKAKNCNKLQYLYWELKSYIHSPVVEPEQKWRIRITSV